MWQRSKVTAPSLGITGQALLSSSVSTTAPSDFGVAPAGEGGREVLLRKSNWGGRPGREQKHGKPALFLLALGSLGTERPRLPPLPPPQAKGNSQPPSTPTPSQRKTRGKPTRKKENLSHKEPAKHAPEHHKCHRRQPQETIHPTNFQSLAPLAFRGFHSDAVSQDSLAERSKALA